jgi:ParB family chromosome partitioning protein
VSAASGRSALAGLLEVPCIEMDVDDQAVAEIALIENLQRKDLTLLKRLTGCSCWQIVWVYARRDFKKIGKARSSVTESLSLAQIPRAIREICYAASLISEITSTSGSPST